MHASLAITPEGLPFTPLGLTAAKFWSRDKFKGTTALKRKINPTRVPIEQKESMRWLDNLRRSTELTGAPERCVHIHRNRAHLARTQNTIQPKEPHKGSRILHDRRCPPRRIFGPKPRSASWNNRHLAGLYAIVRPRPRIPSRKNKQLITCG